MQSTDHRGCQEMANAARFTAAQQEMSRDGSYPYTANS